MPRYRPLTDDEEDLFRSYARYAFRPQLSPDKADDTPDGPRRVGDRRGLFPDDGDDPVAVCAHLWFEADIRGCRLSTPGLSAVATPPEYRRQGHASDLLRHVLEEYRERGDHVSVLWPFKYAFYRDLGWEEAYRFVHHEVEPDRLQTAAATPAGEFSPVSPDEYHLVDEVYRRCTDGYDLAFARDETWWRHRLFESWFGQHYVYRWIDDDGTTRGYLIFRHDGDDRDRTLAVYDHGATDAEAYRQLCRFLADHDSQVGSIRMAEPIEGTLRDHLETRGGVETTIHGGAMVRLVDAPRTLEAISLPADVEATVVLDIADDLVDWHDGALEVAISDGAAMCTRTDSDPEVALDIGTLSAIVVGAQPVSRYVDTGDLTGDTDAIAALEAAFPPRPVWCPDWF